MNRLGAAALMLAALSPVAHAAEVTRIASSFEDDHPFGFFLDVGFERTQRRELISREGHGQLNGEAAIVDLPELRYTGADARLNIDAHIGLYKDLEFHFGLPVVFAQTESWWFSSPTDPATSTVAAGSPNNCIRADGSLVSPTCTTNGAGAVSLFNNGGIPQNQFRGGLGNMHFGLAYAFFNQAKDDTKPTWILALDYEAPTAELNDPTLPASDTDHGKIGDRIHKYTFSTSFSRRMGKVIEPYFHVEYTIPVRGPGWYSDCDHPNAETMAAPGNCGTAAWTRSDTGIQPAHHLTAYFGAEFNAFDEKEKHQRLGIDVRLQGNYVGAGRYFNELSGLLGKYLWTDDYMEVGGSLGINAHASDYVRIQARGTLLYATPHTLTDERLGKDVPVAAGGNANGKADLDVPAELSPNADLRYDVAGRRFRASDIFVFRVELTASFNF